MSGRKQHFIPQCLLSGFTSSTSKGKPQLTVHMRDGVRFRVPTDKIGAERDFYSEPKSDGARPSLDDEITDLENQLSGRLEHFRRLPPGSFVDSAEAAKVVVHLILRTAHMRKASSHALGTLLVETVKQLKSEASVVRLLGADGPGPSEPIRSMISKEFGPYMHTLKARGIDASVLEAFIRAQIPTLVEQLSPVLDGLVATASDRIGTASANGHRKALLQGLSPEKRVACLSTLSWRIIEAPHLILGDCVAVSKHNDGTWHPALFAEAENTDSVCLPLSSDRALIGIRTLDISIPAEVNSASAGCSWDFFVSDVQSEETVALQQEIRGSAAVALESMLDDALKDAFGKPLSL